MRDHAAARGPAAARVEVAVVEAVGPGGEAGARALLEALEGEAAGGEQLEAVALEAALGHGTAGREGDARLEEERGSFVKSWTPAGVGRKIRLVGMRSALRSGA